MLIACASSSGQLRATPPRPFALMPVGTLWTLELGPELTGSAAFSGTRAYFSLAKGQLAAYDLLTGLLDWTVEAPTTRPPVSGEGLIFLVEPEAIAARRAASGALAWRVPFTDALASPLVWDNGWLIATTASGSIVAMRGTDGRLIWRRDLGAPVHARPALAADRVYVPTGNNRIVALLVASGDTVWESPLGGPPNDILVLDDRLYVGSNDNRFYCLAASGGRIEWAWPAGADVIGLPAADAERVYFVALDNVLRAVDRRTGNQRWKRTLPLRPSGGPLLIGDSVVVPGVGPLHAFAREDGAASGELTPPGEELAAPPHALTGLPLPAIVVTTQNIERGTTTVRALSRSIEPALTPVAPLPNPEKPTLPD